jgi:biopolymer transport protein TolR
MRSPVQAAPNVTPMVDVMLVLLIIFMVVAPTLLDGFRADPPKAANVKDHPLDSADVVLGIDAAGNYYLNKRAIPAPELGGRLQSIFRSQRGESILYLKADRSLDYSKVLAAIDIARNSGVALVAMITQQPAQVHP